jgi:DNA-binding NarL/FixJ family response regulator
MVADRSASKHVAGKLAISEGTAKLRLHNIYSKLIYAAVSIWCATCSDWASN